MSEVLPISCISCRRKKIKCNKMKPCNQCIKRSIPCEFPPTFRNIKIIDEEIKQSLASEEENCHVIIQEHHHHSHTFSEQLPVREGGSQDESFINLRSELDLLKNENLQLLQENLKLNQQLNRLSGQGNAEANKFEQSSHSHESGSREMSILPQISIPREGVGEGEKYYGPSSANFMIDSLKGKLPMNIEQKDTTHEHNLKQNTSASSGSDSASHYFASKKQKVMFGSADFPENSSSSSDSKLTADWERNNEDFIPQLPSRSNNLIEQSLSKKNLPMLPLALLKYDDPDISSDSDTYQDLQKLNFDIIVALVELFFEKNNYYATFISKTRVLEFLNSYNSIKDKEWENDDDLLVLYMVLLLSIQKLTPREFLELDLLPVSAASHIKKFRNYLSKNVLYHNFEKLRHNLINESLLTVQAYILCTEWHFIEHRYEECWSMMFHTCSIAYSIGLHVMGQQRSGSLGNEFSPQGKSEDVQESEYKEEDSTRYKVWYALKYLTGQICSILGRPNPVSIQVNLSVCKSMNADNSPLQLDRIKTQIMLKVGVGECIRLSNLMLIENFMMNFTVHDLLALEQKFEEEIATLEFIMNDDYTRTKETSDTGQLFYDEYTNLPVKIDRTNILMDLIVMYINKAKLFEPFIKKFENLNEYGAIVESLVKSVLKSFELLNYFIELFINQFFEKNFSQSRKNSLSNHRFGDAKKLEKLEEQNLYQEINGMIKFGRLFRVYFPFLNSFIYQAIIVVFTLLHGKFRDFVNNDPNSVLNDEFLKQIEMNLNTLLNLDNRISSRINSISKLWPANIRYLIDRVLNYIKTIYERQYDKSSQHSEKKKRKVNRGSQTEDQIIGQIPQTQSYQTAMGQFGSEQPTDLRIDTRYENPEFEYLYGFQFNDPFWLTNPENLPYYLSSPSDDDRNIYRASPTRRLQPHTTGHANSLSSGSTVGESLLSKQTGDVHPLLNVPHEQGMFSTPSLNSQPVEGYGNIWPNNSAPEISNQPSHQRTVQLQAEVQLSAQASQQGNDTMLPMTFVFGQESFTQNAIGFRPTVSTNSEQDSGVQQHQLESNQVIAQHASMQQQQEEFERQQIQQQMQSQVTSTTTLQNAPSRRQPRKRRPSGQGSGSQESPNY
ncbi:fungal transcriptional regulatory protein [Scheffersomyces xylosifermentans]|uniref:fungal transcriptional regulatory protein n=1 Tax=Scheffersomyces xylosifermentans TaxID=1304137 RepID=UPI00315DA7D9